MVAARSRRGGAATILDATALVRLGTTDERLVRAGTDGVDVAGACPRGLRWHASCPLVPQALTRVQLSGRRRPGGSGRHAHRGQLSLKRACLIALSGFHSPWWKRNTIACSGAPYPRTSERRSRALGSWGSGGSPCSG